MSFDTVKWHAFKMEICKRLGSGTMTIEHLEKFSKMPQEELDKIFKTKQAPNHVEMKIGAARLIL